MSRCRDAETDANADPSSRAAASCWAARRFHNPGFLRAIAAALLLRYARHPPARTSRNAFHRRSRSGPEPEEWACRSSAQQSTVMRCGKENRLRENISGARKEAKPAAAGV